MRYSPGMHPIELTPAVGGWVYADWGNGEAWVRFGKDRRERLTRITEIHVLDPSYQKLARVPLGRIHAAVTMRGASLVQLMLALGFDRPLPDFTKPPKKGMRLERRYQLERPPGKRLDDSFYRDVAHAYQSAVAFGLHPRQAIVGDTGAADATVAAWVGEARRRGHLPPAQPGKISP
jgi:hypothetical protein